MRVVSYSQAGDLGVAIGATESKVFLVFRDSSMTLCGKGIVTTFNDTCDPEGYSLHLFERSGLAVSTNASAVWRYAYSIKGASGTEYFRHPSISTKRGVGSALTAWQRPSQGGSTSSTAILVQLE